MKAILSTILVLLTSFACFADWSLEERKVEFLISSVEQLDATFIRNNTEYPARKAASHLRTKFKYAKSQIDRNTFTAELFIEEIASKSSISGEEYLIRFPNGQVVTARNWLYNQLSYFP